MKIIAVIIVLTAVFAFASAQTSLSDRAKAILAARAAEREADAEVPTSVISCYNGTNGTYTEMTCEEEDSCWTKLLVNHGEYYVEKTCKQTEACENLEDENFIQCYGAEAIFNQVRVCHFCCSGDLCNVDLAAEEMLNDGEVIGVQKKR